MTFKQTEYTFQISYDTKDTENHTIDAEQLGSAIVSMSRALKSSNKIINGDSSVLNLEVKAHSEGSFVVEFITLINMVGINPLSIIGFAAPVGGALSVLGALKELSSRKVKVVEKTNENISTLILDDDSKLEVPVEVAEIITNKSIRDNIDTIIKSPIAGSKDAKFIVKDSEGEETFVVDEIDAIDYRTIPQSIVEEIEEEEKTVNIHFTKLNFESSKGWEIRLPDNELAPVVMKDMIFMGRVSNENEQFSKDAMFSVRLNTIKKHRHGTSPTYKREILEVGRQRTGHIEKK